MLLVDRTTKKRVRVELVVFCCLNFEFLLLTFFGTNPYKSERNSFFEAAIFRA